MGQLQKRVEQHEQGQFTDLPEGSIPWQPSRSSNAQTSPIETQGAPRPAQWQVRGLQVGGAVIVILALILFLA